MCILLCSLRTFLLDRHASVQTMQSLKNTKNLILSVINAVLLAMALIITGDSYNCWSQASSGASSLISRMDSGWGMNLCLRVTVF